MGVPGADCSVSGHPCVILRLRVSLWVSSGCWSWSAGVPCVQRSGAEAVAQGQGRDVWPGDAGHCWGRRSREGVAPDTDGGTADAPGHSLCVLTVTPRRRQSPETHAPRGAGPHGSRFWAKQRTPDAWFSFSETNSPPILPCPQQGRPHGQLTPSNAAGCFPAVSFFKGVRWGPS